MSIHLADDIRSAIEIGAPIVALETAVLTSGLPKVKWEDSFGERPLAIESDLPINIGCAKAMTETVQANGAIPAWVGVIEGSLRIGLTQDELIALANDQNAGKVSLSSLAHTLHSGASAGTTVAATLLACRLASSSNPIRVFATGGIGGIHKNWNKQFDISSDLTALATTPTCVVSSGAKSILDVHATAESLETIGVPILGLGHSRLPRFIELGSGDDPLIRQVDTPEEVAAICTEHWHHLGMKSSVLATVQVPQDLALDHQSILQALEQGEQSWVRLKTHPTARTPFLLDQLARNTQGKSLIANLALLCNNAAAASEIAVAFTKLS